MNRHSSSRLEISRQVEKKTIPVEVPSTQARCQDTWVWYPTLPYQLCLCRVCCTEHEKLRDQITRLVLFSAFASAPEPTTTSSTIIYCCFKVITCPGLLRTFLVINASGSQVWCCWCPLAALYIPLVLSSLCLATVLALLTAILVSTFVLLVAAAAAVIVEAAV